MVSKKPDEVRRALKHGFLTEKATDIEGHVLSRTEIKRLGTVFPTSHSIDVLTTLEKNGSALKKKKARLNVGQAKAQKELGEVESERRGPITEERGIKL